MKFDYEALLIGPEKRARKKEKQFLFSVKLTLVSCFSWWRFFFFGIRFSLCFVVALKAPSGSFTVAFQWYTNLSRTEFVVLFWKLEQIRIYRVGVSQRSNGRWWCDDTGHVNGCHRNWTVKETFYLLIGVSCFSKQLTLEQTLRRLTLTWFHKSKERSSSRVVFWSCWLINHEDEECLTWSWC